MFGGFKLGRLAGIPLYINPTWFFVFAFFTYSLATAQLPAFLPSELPLVYWALALVLSVLFFASIVAHELGHSLVSKAYGIPVRSITLHLFGGVAALGREVSRAREELWIALAGPAVSLVLAGIFWGLGLLLLDVSRPLGSGLALLAVLNAGVAVFNMVPGFPLDGGRVLRALVWGVTGDYLKATRVAATGGRLIGYILILSGLYLALSQGELGRLWLALIGFFLVGIARQSYEQARVQHALSRTPVSDAMIKLIAVPSHLTVEELHYGYVNTTGRRFYLVEQDGRPVGLMLPHLLSLIPVPYWPLTTLRDIMVRLEELPEIGSAESAVNALNQMSDLRVTLLRAVENGYTIGVVTQEALLRLITRRRAPVV